MSFNPLMHERNIYKIRPNFEKLAIDFPEFRKYAIPDAKGKIHVDFSDTNALRTLTKVLLKNDFDLNVEIPYGFLIPTVPQRLNYILWVEDLLLLLPNTNNPISGIDIGTGPCAIFSILGARKNNWHFTSTESSAETVHYAELNVQRNNLDSNIKIVKVDRDKLLNGVLSSSSTYDFSMCNPPFYENEEEITKKNKKAKGPITMFARKDEIVSEGGEAAFIKKIIQDSLVYREKVRLYTTMLGKKKNVTEILKYLQNNKDIVYTKTAFCQGNTLRWGIAWTFIKSVDFSQIVQLKPVKNKVKPAFEFQIAHDGTKGCSILSVFHKILQLLRELKIALKIVKLSVNYAEIQITSEVDTWSHQRQRKRKEMRDIGQRSNPADICITKEQSSGNIIIDDLSSLITSPEKSPKAEDASVTESSKRCIENTVDNKMKIESKDMLHCPVQELNGMQAEDTLITKSDELCAKVTDHFKIEVKLEEKSSENDLNDDKRHFNKIPGLDESAKDVKIKIEHEKTSESEMSMSGKSNKKRKRENDNKSAKRIKLDTNTKIALSDANFEPKSLLYCTLRLIKQKVSYNIEMNCKPPANRDSMHQIFQLLKNRLNKKS